MIVRIRLRLGSPIQRKHGKNRPLALAAGGLLVPASLMAYALGFWRLASDMGMAGEFGIKGMFSHWQIWIGTAVLLQVTASILNRYGRGGKLHVPRVLTFHMLPSRQRKEPEVGTGS
jgi:hypothetical protein